MEGDASIRHYFHIDPDTLDEDEWCKLYAESLHINKVSFLNLKTAVCAAVVEIFGNGNNNDTMDS